MSKTKVQKKYSFLIVGSGFFGSTFARLATDAGKTCLVIDKRNHLAGMAHDVKINNQLVGIHGGHIFHTNSDKVWQFINQFCEMEPFINKPKVLTSNKVYSFPINLMTLHQLWGVTTPAEAFRKLNEIRVPFDHPQNFEEWVLDKLGWELYELFIYGYTKKQWMKEPRELPASIIQRLPIRLTYDENYFISKYQSMPKEGYTKLIENMLDGIRVDLSVDFFGLGDWQQYADHLVYTGPIDKFFDYTFGKLEYNTLRFEQEIHHGDYQGNAIFNHVDLTTPYLRSIEHKHFQRNHQKHYDPRHESQDETIVTFDYPIAFQDHPEPYYPIRDELNSNLYAKYFSLKKELPNVTFGGRLGDYKYIDIDQTIASAMQKAKGIICSK